MKTIGQLLVLISLVSINQSCGQDKSENYSDAKIEKLSTFYHSYISAWATRPPIEYQVLEGKLDSLVILYCTSKLQNEARKYWEYNHDLITDDYGASEESPSSLNISRDTTQENVYQITYKVKLYPNPNEPELKEINFKVKMVKENESYRIDEIISNTD